MNTERGFPKNLTRKLIPAFALWANDRPPLPLWRSETDHGICALQINEKCTLLTRLQLGREGRKLGIDVDWQQTGRYNAENYARVGREVVQGYQKHKALCLEIARLIWYTGLNAVRYDVVQENIHLTMMVWELLKAPDMEVAGTYLFLSLKSFQIWRADEHDPNRCAGGAHPE